MECGRLGRRTKIGFDKAPVHLGGYNGVNWGEQCVCISGLVHTLNQGG